MSESVIEHFLLVFNRATGQLEREQHFGTDVESALSAYAAAEREFVKSDWMQIVLVGSDSIETVRVTHANYFNSDMPASKYFAGM